MSRGLCFRERGAAAGVGEAVPGVREARRLPDGAAAALLPQARARHQEVAVSLRAVPQGLRHHHRSVRRYRRTRMRVTNSKLGV